MFSFIYGSWSLVMFPIIERVLTGVPRSFSNLSLEGSHRGFDRTVYRQYSYPRFVGRVLGGLEIGGTSWLVPYGVFLVS